MVGTETYNPKNFPPHAVVSIDTRDREVCEILAITANEVVCIALKKFTIL